MRRSLFFCIGMQVALTSVLYAAEDAAVEAKEGDIEHWIEYYKKERGTVSPPAVTDEPRATQSDTGADDESSSVYRAKTGAPNNNAPAASVRDH